MRLRISLPSERFLDVEVHKIIAEGQEGSFCLEPHHTDYIATLVPGILIYADLQGKRHYVAVDEGVLVKRGQEVHIATFKAIVSDELEPLKRRVEEEILKLDEEERAMRKALARLEAGILHRYRELEQLK